LPLSIRVEDLPQPPKDAKTKPDGQARVTWRKDGGPPQSVMVTVGRDVPVSIPIEHGGANVLELEVEPGPQELTPAHNRAAVVGYVRKGGAFLEAAGPSFGTPMSLFRTPLGEILPTEPTGNVYEEGFKPQLTDAGRRHPVTEDLPGAGKPGDAPGWGRWFRQVEARGHNGIAVMRGERGDPLLVLDGAGKGRGAQLLSDQMWLWARGFEGGGPQGELLRRLAYWLMKEPDREENDPRATVEGDRRVVTRP